MTAGEMGTRTLEKLLASEPTASVHDGHSLLLARSTKTSHQRPVYLISTYLIHHIHFQEKITRRAKRQKSQFEEASQPSEPDSDMVEILEFSGKDFKMTMINTL